MEVSGYKTVVWLVKTVALLVTSISLCLFSSTWLKKVSIPVIVLCFTSALSYILIDIIYVIENVISKVYLADAFVEFVLLIGWIIALFVYKPIESEGNS